MFKNLSVYRLSSKATADTARLLDARVTDAHPLRPCGVLDAATHGFVSLHAGTGAPDCLQVAETLWVTVGSEVKDVPAATLKTEVTRRARARAEETGRPVVGKSLRGLRDEVRDEMLSKAYARRMEVQGFIDLPQGWVVIDTSSAAQAETYLSVLRKALGSLPALPLNKLAVGAQSGGALAPVALMTHWLATDTLPDGLELGESCEMRDDGCAVARLQNENLHKDEIRDFLAAGKVVTRLELTYNDELVFTFGKDLTFRKLKLLDVVPIPMLSGEPHEDFIAEATLTVGEVRKLLARVEHLLHVSRPEDQPEVATKPSQPQLFLIDGCASEENTNVEADPAPKRLAPAPLLRSAPPEVGAP